MCVAFVCVRSVFKVVTFRFAKTSFLKYSPYRQLLYVIYRISPAVPVWAVPIKPCGFGGDEGLWLSQIKLNQQRCTDCVLQRHAGPVTVLSHHVMLLSSRYSVTDEVLSQPWPLDVAVWREHVQSREVIVSSCAHSASQDSCPRSHALNT